jgi:hypothetical protein
MKTSKKVVMQSAQSGRSFEIVEYKTKKQDGTFFVRYKAHIENFAVDAIGWTTIGGSKNDAIRRCRLNPKQTNKVG